jgi:hypothetical protein
MYSADKRVFSYHLGVGAGVGRGFEVLLVAGHLPQSVLELCVEWPEVKKIVINGARRQA